jgi:hypothetical protein
MEKRTLFALVAFVALGLGAFVVMRAPEKGQRSGPRPTPFAPFKAADVQSLEITTDKKAQVTLEKTGAAWRVKTPKDWPADNAGVKSLLDALEKLTFGDLVTESKDKYDEMGVSDGKATHLIVKGAAGKVLADLYIGKNVGGFSMIRPAGKDEVWQGTGLFQYQVNKDEKAWRDHVIFDVTVNDADKLVVEGGGAKLALSKLPAEKDAKPGEAARWKIDEATGNAPKTSEALDVATVNGAVAALASLRAADFADDKPAAETGLTAPSLTLTLTAKGTPHTLIIGATKGDDVYLKTAGGPTVYTVKKFTMERVAHRPIDYRDKTLAKAKEMDLAGIDLTAGGETITLSHGDDKWKSTKPVDDNKLKPVVSAFENLAGAAFAEETDAAKTGLAKPTGVVALHLKDKSTVTLKIGALNKEGSDYFIQRAGSPDVLTIKKYQVDRFLKKASDLAPSAKTAAVTPPKKKK